MRQLLVTCKIINNILEKKTTVAIKALALRQKLRLDFPRAEF